MIDGGAHSPHLVRRSGGVVAHESGVRNGDRQARGQHQVLAAHDQTVDSLVGQMQHGGAHVLGGRTLHLHHGDGVPGLPGRREHALGGQRLTRALDVLSHYSDRPEGAPAQRLGGAVGRVSETLHGVQHFLTGVRPHVPGARGDPGNRLRGDAGETGDVRDRRRAGAAPSLRSLSPTHGTRLPTASATAESPLC